MNNSYIIITKFYKNCVSGCFKMWGLFITVALFAYKSDLNQNYIIQILSESIQNNQFALNIDKSFVYHHVQVDYMNVSS